MMPTPAERPRRTSPEIEEVLSVAEGLWAKLEGHDRRPEQPASTIIPATFLERFLMPGWAQPVADLREQLLDRFGRDAQSALLHAPGDERFDMAMLSDWSGRTARPAEGGLPTIEYRVASTYSGPAFYRAELFVFSALLEDTPIKETCRTIARGLSGRLPNNNNAEECRLELSAEVFGSGVPLPHIRVVLIGNVPPSAEAVLRWYKDGPWKRWQQVLWDGRPDLQRRRSRTSGVLLRGWTLHTLQAHAGLSLRDAMTCWNSCAPDNLQVAVGEGPLNKEESQASEDSGRARDAAARLQTWLSESRLRR